MPYSYFRSFTIEFVWFYVSREEAQRKIKRNTNIESDTSLEISTNLLSVRLDKFNSNGANRVLFNGLSMSDTDYIDQVLGGDQHQHIQIGAKSDINAIKQ